MKKLLLILLLVGSALLSQATVGITGASTPICVGATTTLTSSPAGGTWSSSVPSIASIDPTSGVVTGENAGTAIMTYIQSSTTVTATMTVNPLPAPITGPGMLCDGTSLTVGSPGTWQSSNSAVGVINSSGVITGVSAGTMVITYTASNGCSVTRVFTVNSLPSNIIGLAAICEGMTTTLSSSPAGTWSSSSPLIATVDAGGTVAGLSAGICQISYTLSTGCSRSVAVSVSPMPPPISGVPSQLCIGGMAAIDNAAAGGIWSTGTPATIAIDPVTGVVTGVAAGNAWVTYSTSAGCYTSTSVEVVTNAVCSGTPDSTILIRFFNDNNSSCDFDGGDHYNAQLIRTIVDSSGIPVDTLNATSGLAYKTLGAPGTIYAFRATPVIPSVTLTCLPGGVLYDTVQADPAFRTKSIALGCSGATGSDMAVTSVTECGRHSAHIDMLISNSYCSATTSTLTVTFSHKYDFYFATTTPTSVVGNTITWILPPHSVATGQTYISLYLERFGSISDWLMPGDTVASTVTLSAGSGETDLSNNTVSRVDTVKSSFDPNDIMVTPTGHILPCAQLQYRVRFENMGNAAAETVYVMDTLSQHLDINSVVPVTASHTMNISLLHDGGYDIIRFDFPNIMLADSSQHEDNKGMFVFNINARNGLPDDTHIKHRVGIYFDDNPVVMTNEVENITGMPALQGDDTVCAGERVIFASTLQGGTWAASNAHAGVVGGLVSGISRGLDTISYTASTSCVTRTSTKEIFVEELPVVPQITGMDVLCTAWVVPLSNATPGGIWSSGNTAVATIDAAGALTGGTPGTAMITYSVSNYCGTTISSDTFTVKPMLTPSVMVTSDVATILCSGTAVLYTAIPTFGGIGPTYTWYVNNVIVQGENADTLLYVPVDGDVIKARVSSTELCVTDNYGYGDMTMDVTNTVMPSVSIAATPMGILCENSIVSFLAKPVNGGAAPAMRWVKNGILGPSGPVYDFKPANGDEVYCILSSTLPCIFADSVSSGKTTLAADPVHLPIINIRSRPGLTIAAGQSDTLTAIVAGGGAMPTYQWIVNDMPISGATQARFVSNAFKDGDSVSCRVVGDGVCGYYSFNSVNIHVVPASVQAVGGAIAVSIAPNPSNGSFLITGSIKDAATADIVVRDMIGREVHHQGLEVRGNTVDVQVSLPATLTNGVYMLDIQTNAGNAVYRIVVDR